MTDQDIGPWYRQPWLWFILAPLIATVLYSTIYITASVVTNDGVVLEEYTKSAKSFHEDNSLKEVAQSLGLSGALRFDTVAGDINLELASSTGETLPAQLNLIIGHPTKASLDISVTLNQIRPGYYGGELQNTLKGNKKLIISPLDRQWELVNEAEPPYDQQSFTFGNP
ncbi:FixH family protein [Amphritea sp. 2_MG-2023]|uniref:FixH family protein n=1 Tax=Amphritea TaxID=515417 RepID=UPI001C067219|nr:MULTISPECIES: FixH family protein [Amphritea]MBU2964458.1 FixH family protein [Amphritea atlantica]MDO6417786.1 FixH family protein [Amphritea sp. 2_MG-2023]